MTCHCVRGVKAVATHPVQPVPPLPPECSHVRRVPQQDAINSSPPIPCCLLQIQNVVQRQLSTVVSVFTLLTPLTLLAPHFSLPLDIGSHQSTAQRLHYWICKPFNSSRLVSCLSPPLQKHHLSSHSIFFHWVQVISKHDEW
jgi:hypothetical protein